MLSLNGTIIAYRARYLASDYLNLREAGATTVVPDETEASLRITYSLLDNLGLDSSDVTSFVESMRKDLEVKQEDMFMDFERSKATITVPSGTNRVNSQDKRFPNLENLVPLLNDAKRQIKGMVGARTDLMMDKPAYTDSQKQSQAQDDRFGIVSRLENDGMVAGVDYCVIPPRDPNKPSKSDSAS